MDKESWISQIKKGVLELAILALLRDGEMYGFEIVSHLQEHQALSISAGTIYPLLGRLKKGGLIESVWRESPVGPPRKYYRLTEMGSEVLLLMSESWSNLSRELEELLKGGARTCQAPEFTK